jgi:hypothetical protein
VINRRDYWLLLFPWAGFKSEANHDKRPSTLWLTKSPLTPEVISTPASPVPPDTKGFLAYVLSLEPDDFTTDTHPVHEFSFPYSQEYVIATEATDDGETVRAVSPRFIAGIEVTYLGPVVATKADEDTFPLII